MEIFSKQGTKHWWCGNTLVDSPQMSWAHQLWSWGRRIADSTGETSLGSEWDPSTKFFLPLLAKESTKEKEGDRGDSMHLS